MLSEVSLWGVRPTGKPHIRSQAAYAYPRVHIISIEYDGERYGDAYSDNGSEEDKQMLLDLANAKWGSG